MNSHEERQLQALLEGRLTANQARRFLDSMKGRDDFRERLRFAADAAPTTGYTPGVGTRYQSYSYEEVVAAKQARPVRRIKWFAISVFMIVLLTMVGIITGRDREVQPDNVDLLCREAVAAGIPYLVYPDGERGAIPRIFELILPPESSSVTVRLRHDGNILHEHCWRADDPGVEFDEAEGTVDGHPFPILQALVPFPRSDEVSLEPARTYDFIARVDSGPWSPPREFWLRR